MTDDQKFLTEMSVQAAGVVATLVLAAVALWGKAIRAWLVGPRLELRLFNPQGERQDTADHGPARFYHLQVINTRRRIAPARNVRVMFTGIARPDANDVFQWHWLTGPIQFIWQHGHSLPQLLTIGPAHNADLGRVLQRGAFELSLHFLPIGLQTFLLGPQNKMLIEARAESDETESAPIRVRISWDGGWSEDAAEMARHLRVEQVPLDPT